MEVVINNVAIAKSVDMLVKIYATQIVARNSLVMNLVKKWLKNVIQ